ncbi:conserved Plasmodium protein, unknown function [Plasmodium knowlesi strain H]|uniref:CS domain-containing protein n=3 Tax=Plasmodium knowlesi TaxID=5850 RepID=A0A1A7VX88_PLAKH|nr:uncharacterized protein PKNH_1471000 [Plasmodium knowlesi strain H]OTN64212.1 Uncharacterized protein PKNOH_S140289700 [Plasmodium knowlesi]CAA9991307.1 HSP20-like chaperone, putative [Plasmodium knowlesi strain H]SBO26414.1 conserved Plasmodium protein, unknown function [Plasmodium knowlesi strain H]SBO28986.1 conserved Plasmodium protein, unknown function [Plasmodium knowlesi strain H]VVS80781.1 HSP20-like chaperone, putative [Plasmodium knowlesi strain H]
MTFLCLLWFATIGSTTSQDEFPTVRWGQSSKKLTLIISIPFVEGEKVEFTESNIHLTASNKQGQNFELNLDLLRPIIPEKCSYTSLDSGLKLQIEKRVKEPCWKHLTKNKKVNFLIKDKRLSNATDCEEAKEAWLSEYVFFKRKNKLNNSPTRADDVDPTKKKDINIIDSLKDAHPNFTLQEY